MSPTRWTAKWIVPEFVEDSTRSNPAPILRSDFTLDGTVEQYVTNRGHT